MKTLTDQHYIKLYRRIQKSRQQILPDYEDLTASLPSRHLRVQSQQSKHQTKA